MRDGFLTLALLACSQDAALPSRAPAERTRHVTSDAPQATTPPATAATPPAHRAYPDLAAALVAILPSDARVLGFGELHARSDRAPAASTLASFTGALPAIAGRLSDLVIETWLDDPRCGQAGAAATARIETAVRRPAETRSEIALLADAARARGVQPHAMRLTCADHARIAPASGQVDAAAMLSLTTRELQRIVTSAVAHRDREAGHRPWIAVYGGALHNDRFPDPTVAEWSYAAEVDRATGGRFVEIDLVVPELAIADPVARREPWAGLLAAAVDPRAPVRVWTRGERSFVVILPPATPPGPRP